MKLLVAVGIGLLFLVSCETVQSQKDTSTQPQTMHKNICSQKELICPQGRSYLVTYDKCCNFPETFKK